MTDNTSSHLREQIAAGELNTDRAQLAVAERLDALARNLAHWRPARTSLMSVFNRANNRPPRGLYIHGAVGRGKTMLMDLFFELVPCTPKLRRHFNEFMADVHERIAEARHAVNGDPIPFVAGTIA
jgi:cell division protein ZapE